MRDGSVSLRTATAVARHLDRVPGDVAADQLEGVLVDGLGDLLRVWAGAACLEPTAEQEAVFEARRAQLVAAVRTGLADCWSDPAGQLEPAFVLVAQVLTPVEAEAGLGVLVDALQPEAQADAAAEAEYRSRGLVLRKLRSGGWSLRAHLTDETGELLHRQLTARAVKHPAQQDPAPRDVPAAGQQQDEDVLGRVLDDEPVIEPPVEDRHDVDAVGAESQSPGAPAADSADDRFGDAGAGSPFDPTARGEQSTPLLSLDQRMHDALTRLLTDLLSAGRGSGDPPVAHLTITAPLGALHGRPGAPPGVLHTRQGDVPLSTGRLRRHACTGLLSAVLLDARGRPVGASGTHRHATARERRVLRATWGSTCAVDGCALPGTVPHHAEPWWKSRQTAVADLVPICEHHHHDVHDGHSVLRLRDDRLLDEWGWVTATRTQQQRWAS
ncbi:MAG: hypothetical protein JWN17_2505 [Frankiales bacterium]|nr:hypothetical protein [Frankiales bacterium]